MAWYTQNYVANGPEYLSGLGLALAIVIVAYRVWRDK